MRDVVSHGYGVMLELGVCGGVVLAGRFACRDVFGFKG